jgi:hypothetical protein
LKRRVNSPAHFTLQTEVVARASAARDNSADIARTPAVKSSIAVLSPQFTFVIETLLLWLASGRPGLHRTPEGRWFWCEVNPSPGFTVCQQATGGRIARSLA